MAKKKSEEGGAYKVFKVPIEELRPNPNNPRVIQDEKFNQLVESVRKDGFMLAIRFLVVGPGGVVLGGNQRLKACQKAGLTHVYVVKADDLTEEQRREFIIRDNNYHGEWDREMLSNMYSESELCDMGIELIEFSSAELETIGDIMPEIDQNDLSDKKDRYDNGTIKQIVTYFPSDIYDKVVSSLEAIKKLMGVEENKEALLNLISYWKHNYER